MAKTDRGIAAFAENTPTSSDGKNYFLGIGINAYLYFTPLANARKDVEDVCSTLQENYSFEVAHCDLLIDNQATRNNILKKIKDLKYKISSNDKLIIYYSGHGFSEDQLGYWIPVNAQQGEIGDYISNAEIRELIKTIPAKHILLVSDSCFSASLLVRDVSKTLLGAYKDWEQNPSRWVFISGKGVVADGLQGENSPFAKAILKQLKNNDSSAINIVKLADNVISNVRFNYEQQAELSPLFGSGHEGGQFIFYRNETLEEKEHKAWQDAMAKDTPIAYYTFMEQYPNSTHKVEAISKMQLAEDKADWIQTKILDGLSDYIKYIEKRPNGLFIQEAQDAIQNKKNAIQNTPTPSPQKPKTKSTPKKTTNTEPAKTENVANEGTIPVKTTNSSPSNFSKRLSAIGTTIGFGIVVYLNIVKPWRTDPKPLQIPQNNNNGISLTTTPNTTVSNNNQSMTNDNNTTIGDQSKLKGIKINMNEYNAWSRALKANNAPAYQDYLKAYKDVEPIRTNLANKRLIEIENNYNKELEDIKNIIEKKRDYATGIEKLKTLQNTYHFNDTYTQKLIQFCEKNLSKNTVK